MDEDVEDWYLVCDKQTSLRSFGRGINVHTWANTAEDGY